ncbi:uncharacterized mitochondrial protein AtMg00810-like [Andrographis paniculata]|uniref:uncharacterized mitochondrial protein AtMg00810-like n=1 Tax=Andrographis paniculata TaxID=175694 RepID=UPI0021E84273|nr:uncharacterized mitochondrial protein AtMg00810-like [Andrographis paniculata]
MVYLASSKALRDDFKHTMMSKFEMTNLGLLKYFLRLEVIQIEDGIFVDQKKYSVDLLKRFNMVNCEVAATPMNINEKFMHHPTKQQFGAAKRILRYIAGTLNFGIWYSQAKNFRLVGFTDSDWAACIDD